MFQRRGHRSGAVLRRSASASACGAWSAFGRQVLLLTTVLPLLTACVPAQLRPSWRIYPLQRQQPHDGLAVVSQPDGYGLHLWLETDTGDAGVCRPRWIADVPRLFNGNGTAPFSSGLATRAEFFAAVARPDVLRVLRREMEQLCALRAPGRTWQWREPPREAAQLRAPGFSLQEERPASEDSERIRRQEAALLQGRPLPTSP
ncbi:MAG: hypothetical protein ACKOCM_09465 [Cyanobacteriota bacterium]